MKQIPLKIIIIADISISLIILMLIWKSFLLNSSSPVLNESMSDKAKIEAERIVSICPKGSEECYKKEFQQLTRKVNLKFSQQVLLSLQDIDQNTRSCHVLAHFMAREETRKNPNKWGELIDQVDVQSCGGGYLHGILEAHLADESNFQITPNVINDICTTGLPSKRRMCSHMFGHLFLVQNEGYLDKSLPICEKITDDLRYECNIGIFMEDHQKLALADHGIAQLPVYNNDYGETLIKQCIDHRGTAATACWQELAEIFAKISDYQQKYIYDNCMRADEASSQLNCYLKGVAVMVTHPYKYNSTDELVTVCQPFSGDQKRYDSCLNYIIAALMNYSPKFTERGIKLCSNIEEGERNNCFRELGAQLKTLVPSVTERASFCQGTPNEYLALCTSS